MSFGMAGKRGIVTRSRTGFPPDVQSAIMARAYNNCELMLAPSCSYKAETIHHRKPRGMGGTSRREINYADNGLLACNVCHATVESRREWSLKHGFLVSQFRDPADVPVWWRCAKTSDGKKKMVLLDNMGGKTEIGES